MKHRRLPAPRPDGLLGQQHELPSHPLPLAPAINGDLPYPRTVARKVDQNAPLHTLIVIESDDMDLPVLAA